ncbi:MAG: DUF420 domain-containing protein [Verrucomicrobiales bacterium]|nr:DUF420 domain-containing protein [Verrucomicrobiales bacterium]
MNLSDFPPLNAILNGSSAVLLILGWMFIRSGRRTAHRNCMVGAFLSSAIFLACYLWYHFQMQRLHGRAHTRFVDPAWFRPVYMAILITHLVGAVAILPLIAVTFTRAIRARFDDHRRIARWTLPIWLYVSFTGVVIYLLLYRIFPQAVVR